MQVSKSRFRDEVGIFPIECILFGHQESKYRGEGLLTCLHCSTYLGLDWDDPSNHWLLLPGETPESMRSA